jgi:hypothetical protein
VFSGRLDRATVRHEGLAALGANFGSWSPIIPCFRLLNELGERALPPPIDPPPWEIDPATPARELLVGA